MVRFSWIATMAVVTALALGLVTSKPTQADIGTPTYSTFISPPGTTLTQDLLGVIPPPSFAGGVAFAPDGDVLVSECRQGNGDGILYRFDVQSWVPASSLGFGTPEPIHPVTTLGSGLNLGCSLVNHPNGSVYGNSWNGIVRLNSSTGALIGGPSLGTITDPFPYNVGKTTSIATDPQTGDLYYLTNGDGIGGHALWRVDASLSTHTLVSATAFQSYADVDGFYFSPDGNRIWAATRDFANAQYAVVAVDRSGTLVATYPLSGAFAEGPDGISFQTTTGYVMTNTVAGSFYAITPTQPAGPTNPFQVAPPGSGFRGDLSNVGPDGCIYQTNNLTRFASGLVTANTSLTRICPNFAPPAGVRLIDLGVTAATGPGPFTVGGTVTFNFTGSNAPGNTATGVVASLTIPSGLTGCTQTAGAGSYAGGVWAIGTLAAGVSVPLTLSCTIATAGTHTIDVRIDGNEQDLNQSNNTASTSVSVAANRPPVAVDDATTPPIDTPVTINMLPNDSDPDNDPLTVVSTTPPSNGTVTLVGGLPRYTPNPGFTGVDTFTYTISDGRGGTATATVTVTITPPANRPPVAVDDATTTPIDTPVTINVLPNDSDPDNDPLTVVSTTPPSNGTVTLVGGLPRYTPNPGFTGVDTFTYTISDGRGGTATATVTVTITPAAADERRMTGGGNTTIGSGRDEQRVNIGYQLRCRRTGEFELNVRAAGRNDDRGAEAFKLDQITSMYCWDNPAVDARVPQVNWDTMTFTGTGRWKNIGGATIRATLVDAGEPARNDTIDVTITDSRGTVVYQGSLRGNNQAHGNGPSTPPPASTPPPPAPTPAPPPAPTPTPPPAPPAPGRPAHSFNRSGDSDERDGYGATEARTQKQEHADNTQSLMVVNTSNSGYYRAWTPVTPQSGSTRGKALRLAAWVRGEGDSVGKEVRLYANIWGSSSGGELTYQSFTLTSGWQQIAYTAAIANEGQTNVQLFIQREGDRPGLGEYFHLGSTEVTNAPTPAPAPAPTPAPAPAPAPTPAPARPAHSFNRSGDGDERDGYGTTEAQAVRHDHADNAQSLMVVNTANSGYYRAWTPVTVQAGVTKGKTLQLTAWVRGEGDSVGKEIRLYSNIWGSPSGGEMGYQSFTLTGEWQQISYTATVAHDGQTNVQMFIQREGGPPGIGEYFYLGRTEVTG